MSVRDERDAEVWNANACFERARQGDEAAASELYDRLHPLVLCIVCAHLPRRTAEEDLVQTVFMKVFTKLDKFSGTVPFEHWVSRVAVNTCLKQLRHERVRPELRWADLSEEEERVVQELAATTDDLPGSQKLAARELVGKLLDRLGPADRLVVTLLHLEGRSVAEIRQATGWSRPFIKVRAFRARQRMKKHLEQLLREASS
ncbi:MAG: sigma-70 family RNA polymerase sigma factor [Verrucomicrobiota bacterium]